MINWDKATPEERIKIEEHLAMRIFKNDLEIAEKSLLYCLKFYKEKEIAYVFLRDAIVWYAKPFTKSYGKFKKIHKISKEQFVNKMYFSLHDTLLLNRKSFFAHTDISAKAPDLAAMETPEGTVFVTQVRRVQYEELYNEIPRIKESIYYIKNELISKIREVEKMFTVVSSSTQIENNSPQVDKPQGE